MPRLEFLVVSESSIIDQTTNQSTLVNVLEEVRTASFPTIVPQCVATSFWLSQPGDEERDWQVTLRIRPPDGEPHNFSTNLRFVRNSPRHRVLQRLVGLPLQTHGNLIFEILLNGEHTGEYLVRILLVDPVDISSATRQ